MDLRYTLEYRLYFGTTEAPKCETKRVYTTGDLVRLFLAVNNTSTKDFTTACASIVSQYRGDERVFTNIRNFGKYLIKIMDDNKEEY